MDLGEELGGCYRGWFGGCQSRILLRSFLFLAVPGLVPDLDLVF